MTTTGFFAALFRRRRRALFLLAAGAVLPVLLRVPVPAAQPAAPGAAIAQQLREFNVLGSVLYVAAHPDDENTQLLAFLARGRHYRTAYLSLTRGDGGQNVLGPELGEELGVIRTEELLNARRIDGAHQFFTRAVDFGYSKNPEETLRIWGRRQVLSDVVRVIRTFRPDVVILGSSPKPSPGQHGHHTASAILGAEAFRAAGDAKAFPEQLDRLKPWQPKRLLESRWRGRRGDAGDTADLIRIDVGGSDPATGESFASIAARSRSQHKTQGFGSFAGRSGSRPSFMSLAFAAGEPAKQDLMDGIDTTWARIPGGAEIGRLARNVIERFDASDPAASVPPLLAIRDKAAALTAGTLVDEKRSLLDRIIQECLGLKIQTTVPRAEAVPGETLPLHAAVVVRSDVVPVRWTGIHAAGMAPVNFKAGVLRPGRPEARDTSVTLPADAPLGQPYWLRAAPAPGLFHVADPSLIGRPENPPALAVDYDFEIGGRPLTISAEPVEASTRRRLEVIAPVALRFDSGVRLFAPGAEKSVEVEARAFRPGTKGSLRLEAPAGWRVSPAARTFRLANAGDTVKVTFRVTAPLRPESGSIVAQAEVGGQLYRSGRKEIRYDGIPPILLQPEARVQAVSLDLEIRGRRVGYLPGAGDEVPEALTAMGYEVKPLTGAELTAEGLRDLDAVVIGVRAFNVRDDLAAHLPALFEFAEAGGNVIEQYNRPTGLKTDRITPYSLRLSRNRVTDENAAVALLAPRHPVLNTPNKITNADFAGWVQERGIYFADEWDERWTPILACGDPGEAPLEGGLLVAPYGKGHFVYTGLVFFRQLPAGVPGAYRLFANLISLGK